MIDEHSRLCLAIRAGMRCKDEDVVAVTGRNSSASQNPCGYAQALCDWCWPATPPGKPTSSRDPNWRAALQNHSTDCSRMCTQHRAVHHSARGSRQGNGVNLWSPTRSWGWAQVRRPALRVVSLADASTTEELIPGLNHKAIQLLIRPRGRNHSQGRSRSKH